MVPNPTQLPTPLTKSKIKDPKERRSVTGREKSVDVRFSETKDRGSGGKRLYAVNTPMLFTGLISTRVILGDLIFPL